LQELEAEIEEMEGYILGPENEPLIPDGEVQIQRRYNEDGPILTNREVPVRRRRSEEELQPEKLHLYQGKSVREHREWIYSAENTFRLVPRKFRQDVAKIAWTAQFLRATPAAT
jgi:hypothetical protein